MIKCIYTVEGTHGEYDTLAQAELAEFIHQSEIYMDSYTRNKLIKAITEYFILTPIKPLITVEGNKEEGKE